MRELISRRYHDVVRAYRNQFHSSCVALLYHRVADLKNDPQQLAVSPELFYDHIRHLKRKYCVLSIEEFLFIKKSASKRFPPNSFVLTFDDGYADNYYQALPVLESLQCQSLFYICTGNIGTRKEFWWDELERILYEGQFRDKINLKVGNQELTFAIHGEESRIQAYWLVYPLLKYAHFSERDDLLRALAGQADINLEDGRKSHRVMSLEELSGMSVSKSAMIGAHTRHHSPLSILAFEQQLEEIKESKIFLEALTGRQVKHFSYPYGTNEDYNQDSVSICGQLMFDMVFSNFQGKIWKNSNAVELPRFLVRNWRVDEFSNQVDRFLKH